MKSINPLAILLVAIGLGSLAIGAVYTAYTYNTSSYWTSGQQKQNQQPTIGQWSQQTQPNTPITMDQAKAIAQQYLQSLRNPNLAIKEIMEFQYNFYIIYYERDTGFGAFEMLIWKQTPSSGMMNGGMMGRYATGVIVPEPGPNMMWNTKYSPMANGIMGYRSETTSMTVSKNAASQIAQAYLDQNLAGAKVEMATQFHGYYTFDFTVNGKIAGMLSVNGSSRQVWYHSWHGDFIQEVEFA
jgi:hypothetical protein